MAEITKNGVESGRRGWSFWPVPVMVLGLISAFLGLNAPLLGPDEPRRAEAAREMLERGDWLIPTLGGYPYLAKPVLSYWLEIVAFQLFGVSEFSARLGVVMCGLGMLVCLWIFGKAVIRDLPTLEGSLAPWLPLITASTLGYLLFSHAISLDLIITFTITAALVGYYAFDQLDDASLWQRTAALTAFYFFIGVGLLAKGLIGMAFPFGIVLLYHVAARRMPRKGFLLSLLWGLPITIGVASLWYGPMYARLGWRFIDEFIIQNHFVRFTSNKYAHPGPIYYYLVVLPIITLPWLPFFLVACWRFAKRTLGGRDNEGISLRTPAVMFSFVWMLVPLVFFSLSGSKLPGYILPSLPPAMILTGLFLAEKIRENRRWGYITMAIAGLSFAISIGGSLFALPRYAPTDTAKYLFEAANERGFRTEPVYGLSVVNHSAEFYAPATRLLRDADGNQKKLNEADEIVVEMRNASVTRVLVLVPNAEMNKLTAASQLRSELIATSGALNIFVVTIE